MKPHPTQDELDGMFLQATAARFVDGGVADGKPLGKRVVLELGSADLAEARAHLRVAPPGDSFHCMCRGTLAIELLRDRARVGLIGLHHGQSIRVEGFQSDAMLVDGEGLVRWLAARGVPEPLAEWERDHAAADAWTQARRRWDAAAPPALAPFRQALEVGPMGLPPRLDDAACAAPIAALRAAQPDPVALAASLLRWFGSGKGPWSGYPSYEQVAEALLRALPFDEVLPAMMRSVDDDSVLDGTARMLPVLAYWKRRHDLRRVPELLRERALARTRALDLDDNVDRLRAALREPPPPRVQDGSGAPTTAAMAARGPLSSIQVSDGVIYALDGDEIVRFPPGSLEPEHIATLPDRYHRMHLAEGWLYLVGVNTGVVSRVSTEGGELVELARGQERPLEISVSGENVWWLNGPQPPDPVTGYVKPYTEIVELHDRRRPRPGDPVASPRLLARFDGGAWSLSRGVAPSWVSGSTSGVEIQTLRAGERQTLVPKLRFKGTFPRLVQCAVELCWFCDREVFALGDGKPERLAKLKGNVVCMATHGGRLYLVVERGDTAREIVMISPHWKPVFVARYEAERPDRTELAIDDTGVYWNVGDQILTAPVPPHPASS